MSQTLKKIEEMLQQAADRRTWGTIEVDLKDGRVYLLRQTTQTKIDEDYPRADNFRK